MKKFLVAVFIFEFYIFNFLGCAMVKEAGKGIAGTSTKILEKNRKSAISKTFAYDYFTCYTKALDKLKRLGVYIYAQDIKKHLIAVYVSQQDTTPVGLFFKEVAIGETQVEVSSPSAYAKELIAEKFFVEF